MKLNIDIRIMKTVFRWKPICHFWKAYTRDDRLVMDRAWIFDGSWLCFNFDVSYK